MSTKCQQNLRNKQKIRNIFSKTISSEKKDESNQHKKDNLKGNSFKSERAFDRDKMMQISIKG